VHRSLDVTSRNSALSDVQHLGLRKSAFRRSAYWVLPTAWRTSFAMADIWQKIADGDGLNGWVGGRDIVA